MAFIVGDSLEERKAIVNNVEDFYRVRSALFHHGKSVSPEDKKVVDKFFFNVWFSLTSSPGSGRSVRNEGSVAHST